MTSISRDEGAQAVEAGSKALLSAPLQGASQRHLQWITAAFIAVLAFAIFSPSLRASFVNWDDDVNIIANRNIHALSEANLRWMFLDTEQAMRYKPLSWLSWALLYAAAGTSPWPYHLANLILHSVCTLLVFLLIQRLFERKIIDGTGIEERGRIFCSATGALVWGLHPLRAEPVAWATGLPYGQSVALGLVSLISYLEARAGKRRWAIVSVISFCGALLTYPVVLAFPAVLFVLDACDARGASSGSFGSRLRHAAKGKAPFVAVSTLFVAIAIYSRFIAHGGWAAPVSVGEFGLIDRVMQAFYIWAYYAWKPWAPLDLSPVYTTLVSFSPTDWVFCASAAFVILTTVILFRLRRTAGLLWGLWLCHLSLLVPVLGLTEHPHFPSDRYSYLPAICASILISASLAGLWKASARRPMTAGLALTLVMVLGAMSSLQTRIWQNNVVLFEHILEKLGSDRFRYKVYPRMAMAYQARGENAKALDFYQRILEVEPKSFEAHDAAAMMLLGLGRRQEAVGHLRSAVRLAPRWIAVRIRLGALLDAEGQASDAILEFEEALRLDPLNATAHHLLGVSLAKARRFDDAIVHILEALRLRPEDEAARYNLSVVRSQKTEAEKGPLAARR